MASTALDRARRSASVRRAGVSRRRKTAEPQHVENGGFIERRWRHVLRWLRRRLSGRAGVDACSAIVGIWNVPRAAIGREHVLELGGRERLRQEEVHARGGRRLLDPCDHIRGQRNNRGRLRPRLLPRRRIAVAAANRPRPASDSPSGSRRSGEPTPAAGPRARRRPGAGTLTVAHGPRAS